jgi:TatD DNase family protein
MAANERGRKIVAALPQARLLAETDGPFLKVEGRASRPADVADSVQAIALARGESVATISALVLQNFAALISDH